MVWLCFEQYAFRMYSYDISIYYIHLNETENPVYLDIPLAVTVNQVETTSVKSQEKDL